MSLVVSDHARGSDRPHQLYTEEIDALTALLGEVCRCSFSVGLNRTRKAPSFQKTSRNVSCILCEVSQHRAQVIHATGALERWGPISVSRITFINRPSDS